MTTETKAYQESYINQLAESLMKLEDSEMLKAWCYISENYPRVNLLLHTKDVAGSPLGLVFANRIRELHSERNSTAKKNFYSLLKRADLYGFKKKEKPPEIDVPCVYVIYRQGDGMSDTEKEVDYIFKEEKDAEKKLSELQKDPYREDLGIYYTLEARVLS